MAETTSLESQLIAGAGKAVAYDPEGVVQLAQDSASEQLTEGVKGIATKIGDIKTAVNEQNEGYDENWENTRKTMDENLGSLDTDYWEKATVHAEKAKPIYDACPSGQEGNKCRQRELMKLNQFITHTSEVKKTIGDYNELTKKIEKGDIDESNYKDPRKIAMLGSIDGNKSKLGGKNDAEITSLTEKMKSASGEEKTALREKIKNLKKSNPQEYGWNISYTNNQGNEVNERVTLKDFNDLIPKKDNDVTNKMMTAKNTALLDNSNYKEGGEGSHTFDENVARTASQDAVNEKNLTSYWYDDFGFGEPLNTRIKQHPMLKDPVTGENATYSSLGITGKALEGLDLDKNGLLSEDEMTNLTDALSDPTNPLHTKKIKRLSLEIARDDFTNNLRKESEINLWGDEYWNNKSLVYNEVTYDNLDAKQAAIKEYKSTPLPKEDLPIFLKRGGVVGAAAKKNIFWDDGAKEWRRQEMSGDEMYAKLQKSEEKE